MEKCPFYPVLFKEYFESQFYPVLYKEYFEKSSFFQYFLWYILSGGPFYPVLSGVYLEKGPIYPVHYNNNNNNKLW